MLLVLLGQEEQEEEVQRLLLRVPNWTARAGGTASVPPYGQLCDNMKLQEVNINNLWLIYG